MTVQKSATEYLAEISPHLGSVPRPARGLVCSVCLGPMAGDWERCFSCNRLFQSAPERLVTQVVPMSTALKPSLWYSRLQTYKISAPQFIPLIASVAWKYCHEHQHRIAALLGGPPTVVAIVPSTQAVPHESQPLRRALALAPPLRELLRKALIHREGVTINRNEYLPDAFLADRELIRDARVLLIDDTWISGAKPLSAAGAILDGGARSIAILPIARVVYDGFWAPDHPYRALMGARYALGNWPR